MIDEVNTTTINQITQNNLRTTLAPIPPLAEQRRIVAKVDELMALCDRLEAQQRERETRHAALARASLAGFADAPTPDKLQFLFHKSYAIAPDDLRKSILTLAVRGKLVRQESEAEIFSLESILSEASVNGVSKGPTSDTSSTQILRISAGTSRRDFYVDEDDFKHVDLPASDIKKFQLAPGDLLACRFNGNLRYVGRFSYYRGESGRIQVNPDKLIRFRVNTTLHCPRYVCYAMNAAPTREAIEAMCATTAGNIGLSAGRLKTVKIPLPPLGEQRRIVAKVEELMAFVDALETQLASARTTATELLEAAMVEITRPPAPANIIDLHSTPEFIRAALAAEIVDKMHPHPTFGRVKFQKVIYLVEHIAELREIGSRSVRFQNGPHDPALISGTEQKLRDCEWFETELREGGGYVYRPLSQRGGHHSFFMKFFSEKAPLILTLINEMQTWKTQRCERFATLYAAWNDLIHWGKPVTDDAILREVFDRWHPQKLNIPRSKWIETLHWMREHGYIPTGFGRPTESVPQGELLAT
jgi:type I restriction enzyme S subunit